IAEVTLERQKGVKALQATEEYSEEQTGRLVLAIAVWTALLALGLGLALIVGQNLYLRRPPLGRAEGVKGAAGGLGIGLVAGAAGQWLFQTAAPESSFLVFLLRLVGWVLLGGLVGVGMAFFVRNLSPGKAVAGGALGGAVGAVAFAVASSVLGDFA